MSDKATRITVTLGPPLFAFASQNDWVNQGSRIWRRHGVNERSAICIDTKGRIVQRGEHFQRAEDEGAYPIWVYRIQPPKTDES